MPAERPAVFFDPAKITEKSIHGVHHLLFRIGDDSPLALGCDHPGVHLEVNLTPQQIVALSEDLQA